MSRFGFEISSRLAAPADTVWRHATSMRGVNAELCPLVRMTHPRGLESLADREVHLGTRVFRSWILLFGLVPIDYDDLTLVALAPGRFLERSPMLSQRLWEHERTVVPSGAGCEVTDRIRSAPRIGVLAPVYGAVFHLAFRLRHLNLRRRFGMLAP